MRYTDTGTFMLGHSGWTMNEWFKVKRLAADDFLWVDCPLQTIRPNKKGERGTFMKITATEEVPPIKPATRSELITPHKLRLSIN